jgi:hypothetical protein
MVDLRLDEPATANGSIDYTATGAPERRTPDAERRDYSLRNATSGSTRVARRAGRTVAASAAASDTATVAANVKGSPGVTA